MRKNFVEVLYNHALEKTEYEYIYKEIKQGNKRINGTVLL